jgi:hypothetical protein
MYRALVVVCLLAGVARAEAPDEKTERARAHVKAAIAYYDEGKYDDSAKEMATAYELKPLPDLQYNLAQCFERLNRLEEAAAAYEKYLQGKADAPDRRQVEVRIANLRERAKAEASGKTPPPPLIQEKVVLKTIVVYKEVPPPPGRAARWAAYGLWVLAVGAAASGIAFAIEASQAASSVTKGGSTVNTPSFDSVRSTEANGQADVIVTGVSFGIAGLAAGGGIAMYLIGRKIDREAPKLTLAPSLGPQGGGLVIAGRF